MTRQRKVSVRSAALSAAAVLVAISTPSAGGAVQGAGPGCVGEFQEGTDYFPERIQLEYARGFTVSYHGHYKVLTTRSLARDEARDVVLLVQCGAPVPSLHGDLEGATVVRIPADTLGANEDLSLNRARVLGAVERIVAMGGGGVYAPDIRARWETGAAVSIGESFHGAPDFEKLLSAAPDVVFLSTASLARAQALERARALGIPAVPTMSWVEPSVLGQAEWLYQVAVFLNAEAKANSVLGRIKERYRKLSARARAADTVPLVVWLDSAEQRDQWRVPQTNWIAQLIADAGGRTPWARPDGAPSRIVTTEQVLTSGAGAEAFVTTTAALSEPGAAGALEIVRAIREGRLFDVHRRSRPHHNAYDWYESAVVEVDRVLEDFVALLHPELLPNHDFHHLRPARSNDSDLSGGADR